MRSHERRSKKFSMRERGALRHADRASWDRERSGPEGRVPSAPGRGVALELAEGDSKDSLVLPGA